jgi:hypothetical protein
MDGDAHRYLLTKEELIALIRGAGLRVEAHGFFSPFWIEGHLKTRYIHRLAYRARGRILLLPTALSDVIGRRLCAAQWLTASRAILRGGGRGIAGPGPGL